MFLGRGFNGWNEKYLDLLVISGTWILLLEDVAFVLSPFAGVWSPNNSCVHSTGNRRFVPTTLYSNPLF